MGIKWYDRLSNVEVRKRTESAKLEEMIREKRLRWLSRDNDGGLQNTEPSFKLEPWRHEQEIRKTPEKTGRTLSEEIKGHGIEPGRGE